jgi:hypothetical protein
LNTEQIDIHVISLKDYKALGVNWKLENGSRHLFRIELPEEYEEEVIPNSHKWRM